MSTQQVVDVEQLVQKLQKCGIDTSKLNRQRLNIELTKTLRITPFSKKSLDEVMPYPVLPDKHCIDYFTQDELIEGIRDFLQYLLVKQGTNEMLIYKMAVETPSTVMNNKEIILQLERLAKENISLANNFIHLHSWYSPAEAYHFRFIYGVSQSLEQVKIHYDRLSSQYKAEARFHAKTLRDRFGKVESLYIRKINGNTEDLSITRQKESFELMTALGYPYYEIDNKWLIGIQADLPAVVQEMLNSEIVQAHEGNAEIDYWNLRSLFHGLENKVHMLAELVRSSRESEEFGPLFRRQSEIESRREQSTALSLQIKPEK